MSASISLPGCIIKHIDSSCKIHIAAFNLRDSSTSLPQTCQKEFSNASIFTVNVPLHKVFLLLLHFWLQRGAGGHRVVRIVIVLSVLCLVGLILSLLLVVVANEQQHQQQQRQQAKPTDN